MHTRGFTLLELSIVLVIIALVTGMALTSGISVIETARLTATQKKMKAIDDAMMQYRTANDRIPCPADLTLAPGGTNFGMEAGSSNSCTTGTGICSGTTLSGTCIGTAVVPAANSTAAGGTFTTRTGAEGAVPVVTLGLPNDFIVDGWGNKFRYAVDAGMTAAGALHDSPVNNSCGPITVYDANANVRSNDVIYALISHGPNGHGAYGLNGTAGMNNAGSVNANELVNCHCDSNGANTGYTPSYVQMPQTPDPNNTLNSFDDVVSYKERWQMQTPWDGLATLYFSDAANSVVRKVQNCIITTVAGNGTWAFSGDGGPATSAALQYPTGLAFDKYANLYIADSSNNRIRVVSATTGIITTVAGNGTAGYSGDNGPAISAELQGPTGVAIDSAGNLYIADHLNNRIREVTPGGIITTYAGNGTNGYTGDNGPATSATLNSNAIALDSTGNLYIVDPGHSVVRKVTASTGIITTVAGGGGGALGDGGPATSATLFNPTNAFVDPAGNLYIDDDANQRIRKVTAATGIISTVAGSGSIAWTQATDGDNGPATSAAFYSPTGITLDSVGNLYITEGQGNRVRKVNSTTQVISTIVGSTYGYSGNNGPATSAGISSPWGIITYPVR